MPDRLLQASIDDVVNAATGLDWAISVRDAAGDELAGRNADRRMEIASVGKLLVLVEVARQCDEGMLSGSDMLGRDPTLLVADSGLWRHLHVDELSVHDLCVLVASVSDNVATNVLVKHVGLQRIQKLGASLGLANTAVLDFVRDHRGPDDPAAFSTGSASELSRLMNQITGSQLISQAVSAKVDHWLATGVDMSMVASAFGLDPLSHTTSSHGFSLRNKTGSDPGIRADVGTVAHNDFRLSYAVIANWNTAELSTPDAALSGMNAIGRVLRRAIEH